MIRKCYLLLVALTVSMSSRGEHANVQSSAVGAGAGTLIRNGCGSVNTTDTVGNPSVFGNFSWNVYAWNSTGSDSWNVNYAGYYVDTAMSMNTLNYWADDLSPSYAAGYSGLPVTEDDHSFAARRRGFPTGYYRINVAAHDDDALLFINGIEVWEHIGCCDNHDDVWEGYLSDTSEIDFRVLEYGGGSYGVLDVIPVPLAGMAVSTFVPCHGGNSVLTITAEGGFPPYTGTGSFFVPQGDYQYTIYDSLGDSAIVDVHIPGPAAPDTVIATSIANAFCDGDTVTLTAPSYGKTASFDGNAGRILIPFDSPETDYTYELDFKTTEGYVGLSSVRDGDLSGSFDRDLYLEEGEIRHRLYSEETIGSTGHYYADGLWHHVAVVVESGVGQRIYVDGDEVANGGMDHSDFNWDNTINIGFAGNFMNGEIDNIRLWNVVRTPSEIIQDQNLHVVGWQQGLIGNWDFDESDGLNVINTVDNSESEFVNGPTVAEHNSNTYLWNNGSSSQSITITDGGTYTVQITNVNGCPMNDLSLDLTRHAMPAAPTINANSSLSFCSGNEVTLMTPDTGSIQWKKNGEDIEHENSEQLTVSEEGNYSVTITSSFGCATTSSEQFVEVFPSPPVPSITATGSTGFCQGNSIDLDAHSDYVNQRWASEVIAYSTQYDYPDWAAIQILGEPDVYPGYGDIELSWSPAGQDEPSQFLELGFSYPIPINFVDIFETFGPGTVDSIYVMNPGTGLYELVYSDVPEVCGDSAFVLHATFPMTSFPVSQIRIHMDMSAVPGWNDFDAVRIGSDVPAGYTWSTGDTSSTINVSSTGSFTVSVTNSLGCTSVSPQVDVVVYPTPVVSAGPDIYTGSCSGVIALNNASPSGGSFSGSGVSGNEFDASIGAGNYTLEYFYTDSNGCSASDEMEMTIVDAPVVTLTAFDNVCADAPAFALTGGLPAGGVYTGNGVTNGVFDPSIGAGSYTITYSYQDSLGCGGSASQSFTVDVCMGIYNADDNSMISYYPNPAGEHVTFDLSQAGKVSTVEIFSSAGAKLYHRQISEQGESHLLEADLSNLPAGAYTVRVVSDKGVFNKKLMKQK